MGNIVLLDDLTINQIAAGEVIERPASVIKEMVENSIDAGANQITVEIKNGGISYIKVTDNGKGIAQDDLEIAFERHATSKIRSAEDLDTVTSMGFRGEALASIAAIANIEMISKTAEQEIGYRVVVEAGNVLEKEEKGCQTGTSIIVKNLFFNTPVRYKFLKKDYTESGYIEDVITRIALVHPEVAIKLINTGKTVIQTNGSGDIKNVIYSIYGKDIASGILPVSYSYEGMEIKGVIGKPEIARSNRANQLFFVNNRYIKDKILSSATEQAYKGMIPIGKFGFVVLNIKMNPAKVDVNVHPAKLEVRFEEESKVFQAIFHAIKDTLLKNDLVAGEENQREVGLQDSGNLENKDTRNSLFGSQRSNQKIEQYTQIESEIKTNQAVHKEEIPNLKASINGQAMEIGVPLDTSDILGELRKMQQNIQNEVAQNPNIKLHADYIAMSQENEDVSTKENEKIKTELESEIVSDVNIENDNLKNENNLIEDTSMEKQEEKEAKIEKEGNEENKVIAQNAEFEPIKEKLEDLENNTEVVSGNFDEMYAKLFGRKPAEIQANSKNTIETDSQLSAVDIVKDNMTVFEEIEEYKRPIYKFIGIAFNTYIIIEMNQEMYILDQHAAHERIMYEKVKQNYYSELIKDSQMLLLPDVITLTHKEMDIAKENMDMFEKAGFSLEEFGENTIKLMGVPTVCIDLDTKELFLETLDEINTVARTAKQEKEERFIATVACKAAVKANMVLSQEEVENLMDQLLKLPNPFTCPHGRPTAIKMTKYDIERKFARK